MWCILLWCALCGIPSGKDSQVSGDLFRKSKMLKSFEVKVNRFIWKFWTVSLLRIRKECDNGSAPDWSWSSLLLSLFFLTQKYLQIFMIQPCTSLCGNCLYNMSSGNVNFSNISICFPQIWICIVQICIVSFTQDGSRLQCHNVHYLIFCSIQYHFLSENYRICSKFQFLLVALLLDHHSINWVHVFQIYLSRASLF